MLDRIDKKILWLLDEDSRQSLSAIARSLKLGRDIVEYRVSKLQENGVITGFSATINPRRLGLLLFKIYLQLGGNSVLERKLKETLAKHPRVFWIATGDGHSDLLVGLLASSPEELFNLEAELFGSSGNFILSRQHSTVVETRIYRKKYLSDHVKKPDEFRKIGEVDKAVTTVDELELGLIQMLCENARETVVTIATRLETTVEVVRNRMFKLEQLGIITGYRVNLNLSNLNMLFVKTQIQLRVRNKLLENQLERFCAHHSNITYHIRQIGTYSIELELEVDSYEKYYEVLNEIKLNFDPLIRNFESIFIRKENYRWGNNILSTISSY